MTVSPALDAAGRRRSPRAVGAGRRRPGAVAQAAASVEATARAQALTQRILADVGNDACSRAPAGLVDLHERLDGGWRSGARRSEL